MSQHSLVGTVTRLAMPVDRMEEEKMVNRRLEEVQGKEENMMWRITRSGWNEMKDRCGKVVDEVVEMCEMARVMVEQFKVDISVVLERRNIIIMSTSCQTIRNCLQV